MNEIDPTLGTSTSSNENDNDEVEEEALVNTADETCDLKEQLTQVKADNAMLHERLNRALNDLETISKLNNKKVRNEKKNVTLEQDLSFLLIGNRFVMFLILWRWLEWHVSPVRPEWSTELVRL